MAPSEETIAKFKSRSRTSEQKFKHLEHLNRLNSSEQQQKRLKILNASQEQR